MRKENNQIKRKHISIKEYMLSFIVLAILAGGQTLIHSIFRNAQDNTAGYIIAIIVYFAIIALIFVFVTNRQLYRFYDMPIRKLSDAASRVAKGDFSIWVEPMHKGKNKDYVDAMFEDFNKMVAELGSIETLKNDFIANVSHEIKTPLAVIQSYAIALKDKKLPPEIHADYLDTIISASKKLSNLMTNILKLSKLDNTEIIQSNTSYDLCRQLCSCALLFEELWEQKNIEFQLDIDDSLIIFADESMLELVWNNLLSNALKFTNPGGKIILKQTSDNDAVIITVSDNGCGMNEETKKHIFDKFYQADTSHSHDGNGLGLTLVLRIVELIGASITVKSELGIGTTFTVRINLDSTLKLNKTA